jgi:hypothetical protein
MASVLGACQSIGAGTTILCHTHPQCSQQIALECNQTLLGTNFQGIDSKPVIINGAGNPHIGP